MLSAIRQILNTEQISIQLISILLIFTIIIIITVITTGRLLIVLVLCV